MQAGELYSLRFVTAYDFGNIHLIDPFLGVSAVATNIAIHLDSGENSYRDIIPRTVSTDLAVDAYNGTAVAFGTNFRVFHIDLLVKISEASICLAFREVLGGAGTFFQEGSCWGVGQSPYSPLNSSEAVVVRPARPWRLLGMMILVALPSATFSIASSDLMAST